MPPVVCVVGGRGPSRKRGYSVEHLGHEMGISPWDMVDALEKMRRSLSLDDDVKALLFSISQKLDYTHRREARTQKP